MIYPSLTDLIIIHIILLVLLLVVLHYAYFFTMWSGSVINGPTPMPFFGNMLEKLWLSGTKREIDLIRKYGRVYGSYEMTKPVLTIADPVLLKNILVRDFSHLTDRGDRNFHRITRLFLTALKGDEWRRVRGIMTPTFTSGKMKGMMPLMKTCVDSILVEMKARQNSPGTVIDVKKMFACFTMDVIAKCAFATETSAHKNEPASFSDLMFSLMNFSTIQILPLVFLPRKLLEVINYTARMSQVIDYCEVIVKEIIRQRRESDDNNKRDMLQLLIEAAASEDDIRRGHAGKSPRNFLSEDEIVANTFLMLIAGHETTASLLTFTTYALARHPDVQERLRQELVSSDLSYESLSSLPYLDAVVSESLRLYTPLLRIERMVTQEYRIESVGITLKKGSMIRVPIHAIHHDPEFFPNPDEFLPERFLPENRHNIIPYTYLPFGAGPRICIGMRFALLEAKMALASCLSKFRFLPSAKTPDNLEFSRAHVLLPATLVTVRELFVQVKRLQ